MRKIVFNFLYFIGIGHLLFFLNRIKKKAPILLYHRVDDTPDLFWPPIKVDKFEKAIIFLKKFYEFVPLKIFIQNPEKLKANSCALVFDDGFLDFHDNVIPILQKHKIPCTMFLSIDFIDKNRPIWTSHVNHFFKKGINCQITLDTNGTLITYRAKSEQEALVFAEQANKKLMKLGSRERKIVMDSIQAQLGITDFLSVRQLQSMNWNQITKTAAFIDYQSHTVTHPYLPSEDYNSIEYELSSSKCTIQKKLNKKCDFIAYPIGGVNEVVKKLAKKYYKAGFAVKNRLVSIDKLKSRNQNYLYEIPRFNVTDSNCRELFLRINGFHGIFKTWG